MEIKGIKYINPIFDGSGYSQAGRQYVLALHKLGIPITISPISFELAKPNLGEDEKILRSLVNKKIDYNVVLCHTTPEFFEQYKEPGKVFCGYTIWETTKLHPSWPKYINNTTDLCMVGCDWNVNVFKESGVTVPIVNIPHIIDVDEFKNVVPYNINGINDDTYTFYFIGQFTERKNVLSLIKTYWRTFRRNENVALVMKTYRSDYSEPEKDAIRTTMKRLKSVCPMEDYTYPPVYLVLDMLSDMEIKGLHVRGDCYISLDRGEGFGLSTATAGAAGNPVISTGFGGVTEYLKKDNSYLVDYVETCCFGMPWCMSSNSLIKTDIGYIKAESLQEGTRVYNKNLKLKNINKVEFRPIKKEEDMYSVKYYSMFDPIEVTGEHKLYVLENDTIVKKKVRDININDYLYIPKPSKLGKVESKINIGNTEFEGESLHRLLYLCGLYLAEGYISKTKTFISFSFNINEKLTLINKCKTYMEEFFGEHISHIYERELFDRNGYEINFYSEEAVKFFVDNFGTGSHNKFISDKIKYNFFNSDLILGYWDGDGHVRKEGYKNKSLNIRRIIPECVAETSSFCLSLDLREVLLSLNIVPSIRKNERNDGRVGYIFSISDEEFDNILEVKVKRIKNRYKKKVANGFGALVTKKEILENYKDLICSISVDIDDDESLVDGGSYILNGIASSNSRWYSLDQYWAFPNEKHASELMRYVYENRMDSKNIGLKLQNDISKHLNWKVIGQKIIDSIKNIKGE